MTFNIPDNLKNAIENDSLILFVGAGLSKPLGLPNWNELILSLIRAVSKEKPEMASAEALFTSGIMDTFKTLALLEPYKGVVLDELEQILDKQVDYSSADLTLQKQLWKVSSQIFTANYDRAIEIAGGHDKDVFVYDNANKIRKINSLKNYVFKIHGDIKDSADCILFESQYNKLYTDNNGAVFELKSALAHKTVLFIGFSMNDPYVKGIVEFIQKMFNGLGNKHYLIRTDNESFIDKGIETIDINSWTNLSEFLSSLIKLKIAEGNSTVSKLEQSSSSIIITSSTNRLNDYPKPDPLFTGREKEIGQFKEALEIHRVFAVEGLGGTGKTQLVSKCINDFIEDKSKIIWLHGSAESKFDVFVESAGYGEVLKGEKKTQQAIYSGFKDLIERDERIIFLDNYQSILDKTFADFLTFASPYLAKSRVIFISKEDVNIGDSYVHPINVTGLKEQSIEYALKLKNSRADFEKISEEQLNILCDKTEGHPLAIKLCMPLLARGAKAENIISDIGKYKQLQGVEQLTKRIFDEVYNQCTVEEQVLLQKISVFNNKVLLEAVDFINGSDSFVLVNQLIDKFLLSIDDNNCYSLHPLIRELSMQLLERKVAIHSLAAEYYTAKRNETLEPALETEVYYHLYQSNQWEKIEENIVSNGNLYIQLGQLVLLREMIDSMLNINIKNHFFNILIGDIYTIYGLWLDAKEFYEYALIQDEDLRVKAEGIIKFGETLFRKGEMKESLEFFEKALELCEKNSFILEKARTLNDMALVYDVWGDFENALKYHKESLYIREEQNDIEGTAASLGNISSIYKDLLNYKESYRLRMKSLRLNQQINNKIGIALALEKIADILTWQNKLDEAVLKYNESLSINVSIGNRSGISNCISGLGIVYDTQKKYALALKNHYESLSISEEMDDRQGIAASLYNISLVLIAQGKASESLEKMYACLELYQSIGDKQGIYQSYIGLSEIYMSNIVKDYRKSIECCFRAWILGSQMKLSQQIIHSIFIDLKSSKINKTDFNNIGRQLFKSFSPEEQSRIPIDIICKDDIKMTPPISKNSICPCGSGKQYKRCHGKSA